MKFLAQALNKLIYTDLAKQMDFLDIKDIVKIEFTLINYRRNGKNNYVDARVTLYNRAGAIDEDLWSMHNVSRIHKAFENIFSRQSALEYTVYCDAQKNVDTVCRVILSKNGPNSLGSGKTVNNYYLKTAL